MRSRPAGCASVQLRIEVRDFALIDRLGSTLARHEAIDVHGVDWTVDDDNPAWPQVRAAAIDAAVQKGRDYAAALGGTLLRIEHVADVGLLGGADHVSGREAMFSAGSVPLAMRSGRRDAPSLDPAPQLVQAVIEARFVASVRPLA